LSKVQSAFSLLFLQISKDGFQIMIE
jgi:hypothetical protein